MKPSEIKNREDIMSIEVFNPMDAREYRSLAALRRLLRKNKSTFIKEYEFIRVLANIYAKFLDELSDLCYTEELVGINKSIDEFDKVFDENNTEDNNGNYDELGKEVAHFKQMLLNEV